MAADKQAWCGTVVKNSPLIFKQEAERKKLGLVALLKLKAHPQ